jgi:3',5'-nucleoside bisphosphate phosphatase
MRADLHIHTTASDGRVSPARTVRYAAAGDLDLIAVTDHDTAAGLAEAQREAGSSGVRVLSGIEISCRWDDGMEVHLLGYGIDPEHEEISGLQDAAGRRREKRMREMVVRLQELGVGVTMEQVKAVAGGEEGSTLSRAHLAQVLLQEGHVTRFAEAFDRFIGEGRPGFVSTPLPSLSDAATTVHRAGGLSVWAHPPLGLLPDLLPAFVERGLDGVECYRSNLGPAEIARAVEVTEENGCVVTGGSDWHGRPGHRLGAYALGRSTLAAFLERLPAELPAGG